MLAINEAGNMSFKLAVFDVDGTLAEIHRPAKLEVSRKLRDPEKLGAKRFNGIDEALDYLKKLFSVSNG